MPIPFVRNNLNWQIAPAEPEQTEPESLPEPFVPLPVAELPVPVWNGIPNAEREWLEQNLQGSIPMRDHEHVSSVINPFPNEKRLFVGANVFCSNALFNLGGGKVYLRDHVFFGQGVMILTGGHSTVHTNRERQAPNPRRGNDIVIEEGVWIASGAIIIGPCRIGAHSVIAAGSVVLPGDYESGCVYAGCPAELKKHLDLHP